MHEHLTYIQIGELGNIVTGKTPKTSNAEYWGGDIPFITPTDIPSFDTKYLLETERTISQTGAKAQKNTLLPPNSLCVSCIATIGKMCLTNVPSITNQQINSIVVDKKFNADYLLYAFRYHLPYLQLIGGGTGSGTPIINKNKFSKLKYPIHDKREIQDKIALILDNFESLIENNKKRIKLLDEIGALIYKERILKHDFSKTPDNFSSDGWKQVNLFDIADVTYGFPFKSELFTEEESDISVVRIRDIPDNYTKTYTSEKCEAKYLIKKNDLLVGMDGMFHMCLWNGNKAYLNQRVARIVSKNQNMCNYLLFLSIKDQIKFWEQTLCGTTVSHLGDKHLKRVTVLVPDDNTLCSINSLLAKIMEEKTNLFNQNQNLIIQRDCYLARLMSGKLSVEGKEIV